MTDTTEINTLGLIEGLDREIENAQASADALREHFEERIVEMLPRLDVEQLYDLATACDSEEGPDHCWRCKAFELYNKRSG